MYARRRHGTQHAESSHFVDGRPSGKWNHQRRSLTLDRMPEKSNFPSDVRQVKFSRLQFMAVVGSDLLVRHTCPKCRREFGIPLSDLRSKHNLECPHCGQAIDVSVLEGVL
jgi:hypothetical protein